MAAERRLEPARAAAMLSTIPLLAGIWLTLSPSGLGYGEPEIPFGGVWNETVVGINIAVVALIRILTSAVSAPLSGVNAALGGWLIIAPFALDYGVGMSDAVWNDAIVGTITIVFSVASWAVGREKPAGPDVPVHRERRVRPAPLGVWSPASRSGSASH